ncbi:hypothetical protein [uncultured Methylophaga sp.]|uniref:hypothetical protein n=1 Tax=uncultured Methylophaga sp. TaxID=285271 RepID=UPI002639DE9E|nr:hypothetical protein [uncultured Methylophaga sp.]
MKALVFLVAYLLLAVANAGQLSHKGITYEVRTDEVSLECRSFKIISKVQSLPFSLRESEIPYEITMGHYGKPHVLEQSISYVSDTVENDAFEVDAILPAYERIDDERKYLAKPVACVGPHSVAFSLWGGGNCKTVCEAWVLVEFSGTGKPVKALGLTYSEFKQHN